MIIIPDRRIVISTQLHFGMKGFLRMQTRNKFSGKVTQDTGWFPNTILTSGRNVMAIRSDWINWCQVGTDGVFPPLLADRQAETSLGNWFAGTSDVVSGSISNGQAGSAPYYGWKRKTFRFAAGSVQANLSEAGVGWGVDGSQLISRAPILDPVLQTPTTITPLADELLDVSYELRYYPPLGDVTTPQVTLDSIVYDTITRAASVTGDRWSASIGSAIGEYSVAANGADWRAYDGDIGTILTGPSGVVVNCDNSSQYNSTYSDLSYAIVMNCNTGITGWNLGAGIRSIRIRSTAGDYQTQFNANIGGATIPKTTNFTMHMEWTLSWAEKV